MKGLFKKREELTAKYMQSAGFQKGFTLIEILAVVVIILILLALVALAFTFFGRVDGTELYAESKNVESAVLQVALGDEDRDIPALEVTGIGNEDKKAIVTTKIESRADVVDEFIQGAGSGDFINPNDAAVVIEAVAKTQGLEGSELVQLLRPVAADDVQASVSGKAEAGEYFVVVKKAQLYKDTALEHFVNYNDELAGQVFSTKTVIDSDGVYYNGTHVVSKEDADEAKSGQDTAGAVFKEVEAVVPTVTP